MKINKRINKENIRRGVRYFRRNGFTASFYKAAERLKRDEDEKDYMQAVFDNIASAEERELERSRSFTHSYRISLLVPAYETDREYLKEMMESVIAQSYSNWELCIADGSCSDAVRETVDGLIEKYGDRADSTRIKYERLKKNEGIAGNTNAALKMATGEYVALLDHDDMISPDALYRIMDVLEEGLYEDGNAYKNRIKAIYSDEDKFKAGEKGYSFFDHHVKPGFDIDLLRTNNYICHLFAVRRELALSVGGFNDKLNGSQDHDFIFKCLENLKDDEICHIGRPLYHWRSHDKSTATNPESKLYAYEAGKQAVSDHLRRMGISAKVLDTKHLGFYRVKYDVPHELLENICRISYADFCDMTAGDVRDLKSDYIMIMADNVKPLTKDYEEELLGHLIRPGVGAVGGKMIGRGGRLESAGYSRQPEGELKADFAGLSRHFSGYLHRADLQRSVDGVAVDCMMVKKSAITDDKELNTDYRVVYTPYAVFKRK